MTQGQRQSILGIQPKSKEELSSNFQIDCTGNSLRFVAYFALMNS